MRLETRFSLIMVFCFALGVSAAGLISYRLEAQHARDEIRQRAALLLEAASAVRAYTVAQVGPILAARQDSEFHAAQVPSFAAQDTLRRLAARFPEYGYRESSLNPTNVADRATDWEVGLLRRFEQDPRLTEQFGEAGSGAQRRFFLARPIRVGSPACLRCHGRADAAPAPMLAQYGSTNGFGWKLGEVVGLQIVDVPTAPAQAKAWSSVLVTIGSLAAVFVLTAAVFMLLLRRHVTHPLELLTRAAHASSVERGAAGQPLPQIEGQFGELQAAIQRLRHSVEHALARGQRGD